MTVKKCKRLQNVVAHPFEITMGDPEFVEVCYAKCNLRQLSVTVGINVKPHEECTMRSSPNASGWPLDWILCIPSRFRWASIQR